MSLRKAAPGEGAGGARVHFRYVSVAHGKSWPAHVAGPCQWFMCHTSERTKPCLHWISYGALPCPRCKDDKEAKMLGYMPLYRSSDGCPVMVVVYEDQRDHVDALQLHQRVTVGREAEKGDAVFIRAALSQEPKYHSTLPCRLFPADITETLLVMWKLPELVEWHRAQPKVSDNAASLPKGVAVNERGEVVGPMYQAAAKKVGFKTVKAAPLDAAYDKVQERLRAKAALLPPSTNGNGKHDTE